MRAESAGTEVLFPAQTALNIPPESAALNDSARFLAGLPAERGRDAFAPLRASEAWKKYSAQLDGVWSNFANQHGGPVNSWARSQIDDLRSAKAVFYPFSGPDFLFAQLFYPKAETYVLCGLEPCEPLPAWNSLTPEDVSSGLEGLVNSLSSILHFSYFITKDMRQDLQATRFRGVLPVFMVFLARTGHAIESVDAVRLDGNGSPVVFAASQSTVPGFLIRVRGPNGPKRIFYFSQDLSNGSLSPNGPFLRFIASLGKPAALVKSASYLMHESYFSNVRNHLLTQTCGIVQDPSGVPYHNVRDQGLRLSLYGNYQNALDIFKQYEQPDLAVRPR
ncbi:MAG: hypothetical protein K8R87_06935 [Verrucomicrobia bacterium]|nr:hypothetical protein [Verrucomicrobiota bacterium]